MARSRIALIGAGQIGARWPISSASKSLATSSCWTLSRVCPRERGFDIAEASPVDGFEARYAGTSFHAQIVAAGVPRKGVDRKLNRSERKAFKASVDSVRSPVEACRKISRDVGKPAG
jgi:hypothetical protein